MKYILLSIFFIMGYDATSQCLVNSLIINTGYNPLTGQAITPGANGATPVADPHWIITSEAPGIAAAIVGTGYTEVTPGNSADVITAFPAWASNPVGNPGEWISCLNSTAYTTDGTGPNGTAYNMKLSRSFKLCSDDNIKLNMYMANDNYISEGDIDGIPITGFPTSIYVNNFASFTNYTQTFYLTAGPHTINITVVNYNDVFPETNWTGLNIYGTVASVSGLNSLVGESDTVCAAYTCSVSCNSVSLSDSLHACPGNAIMLPGTITGTDSVINIAWSPATGLSDTSILTPTLTVGNTSSWHTLTVQSLIPFSNVANGSFTDGNAQFTSAYPYHPSPSSIVPEGDYTVSTNPLISQSNFTSFGDHTTGTGKMMVINGGSQPTDIWVETIPVTPNTDYHFSAWIANCSSESVGTDVPIMQFKINSVLIGAPATISAAPGTWVNFFSSWNSGSSTVATIGIYDANTSSAGNDYALDDISFNQVCVAQDSVYVQSDVVAANFTDSIISACKNNTVYINNLSQPPGIAYNWNFGDGSPIENGFDPTHIYTTSGTYTITLVAANGPCMDTAIQSAVAQVITPPHSAAFNYTINTNCTIDSVVFNNLSVNAQTFEWSFGDGNTDTIPDPSHLYMNGKNYTVILITSDTCGDKDTATAALNLPVITFKLQLTPQEEIVPLNTEVTLKTAATVPYNVLSWQPDWLFPSQNAQSQTVKADSSRSYSVMAQSQDGCIDSASVLISVTTTIFLPDAFTPNGDGRDDYFHPRYAGDPIQINFFRIYNRWGQIVYDGTGEVSDKGWDGTFHGQPVDIGVYFYAIQVKTSTGEIIDQKGDVTLIR